MRGIRTYSPLHLLLIIVPSVFSRKVWFGEQTFNVNICVVRYGTQFSWDQFSVFIDSAVSVRFYCFTSILYCSNAIWVIIYAAVFEVEVHSRKYSTRDSRSSDVPVDLMVVSCRTCLVDSNIYFKYEYVCTYNKYFIHLNSLLCQHKTKYMLI